MSEQNCANCKFAELITVISGLVWYWMCRRKPGEKLTQHSQPCLSWSPREEDQKKDLGIYPGTKKKSKYNSRKVAVDGITFDSRKEAEKYIALKLLKKAREIVSFELQPEFELQPGYRDKDGKWVRPVKYRADFRVTYSDGRVVVIDVKPSSDFRTKEYRIKKKMLLYRYPDLNFEECY